MFKISHRSYFWLRIFVGVIAVVGIIQLIRVNRPAPVAEQRPAPVKYTSGPVVEGTIEVPAGEFLSYEIKLNRHATLTGNFKTSGYKGTVGVIALDEANFANWRDGREFKWVSKTGALPGGNLTAKLQAGNYYLVFDNRHSADSNKVVEANFSVD